MKLRPFLLAAAGIAGTVSVASAQPAPAPAQPPPPAAPATPGAAPAAPGQPAQPPAAAPGQTPAAAPAPGEPAAPPAPPGAQPAAPEAPPPPVPAPPEAAPPPPPAAPLPPPAPPPPAPVVWSSSAALPGADTTSPEGEPVPLPWHDSTLTWNQAATTTILGIGRDNIGSEGEFYGWDFTLRPRYYFVDQPKEKLFALGEIGFATELTNGPTVDQRETQFKDMLLGVRYQRALWESSGTDQGEHSTTGLVTPSIVLPTSPPSYTAGKYLTAALGAELQQKIKLLGKNADGLNNVTARLGLTYSHLFSQATEKLAAEEDILHTRPTAASDLGDQLTGTRNEIDRLTVLLGFILPLYKDLGLVTEFRWINGWVPGWSETCVAVDTGGCAVIPPSENGTTYRVNTIASIGLNYTIYEVVELGLGYQNETSQLGEDGQRRNMFYSPDAQFYLDITANLDKIYSKVTRRGDPPKAASAKPRPRAF